MDRDIPSFNKAVMDRIYAKNHQLHLKRLKNIKSSISSNKPYLKPQTTYLANSNSNVGVNYHTKLPQYNNLKKEVAVETKNAQIQRENAILFQKMIKIMKRPDKNNDPALNKQRTSINIAKQRMSMQFSKINQENRALFHRLQGQRPTIENKKLQEERVKNLNILKFLGKYPNYQAISKTHNKSFDLKSRRMNSTSNRPFYNNISNDEQFRQHFDMTPHTNQDDGSNLIEFHNQMTEYNRDMRRLKMQQHYQARVNTKMSATMAGFGRRVKQATQSNTNNSRVVNEQVSKIEIYQPVVPNRKRYLSQNQPRRAQNKQQVSEHNINTSHHREMSMDQQSQAQFRAYHLNHPSYNIVIQDQNMYNKYKKWNVGNNNNNRVMNQADMTGETNFNKSKVGVIQHQRRLNSKNSQQNMFMLNQQVGERIVVEQGNVVVGDFNAESSEPVPIPRFAQVKGRILSNKNIIQNSDNILEQDDDEYQQQRQRNKNVILLYKGVVELKGLFLQQEKGELLSDIYEGMHGCDDDEMVEIPMRLLDWVLKHLSAQISIHRLFDSYKIVIEVNANGLPWKKRTKDNEQQEQIIKQFDNQLIQWLRNSIIQRMQQILAVEIPQIEGSMLLEGMDYDYKEFIRTMVRIQKDCEGQEGGYRVAIVLVEKGNNQVRDFSELEEHNDDDHAQNIDGNNNNGQGNKHAADNDQQIIDSNSQQQQQSEEPKQQQPEEQNHHQQSPQSDKHSEQQQHNQSSQDDNHGEIINNNQDSLAQTHQQQQQQLNHPDTVQGQSLDSHNYVEALDEELL